MVRPYTQNATGNVSQTSFTCQSKREKVGGTTTNTQDLDETAWGEMLEVVADRDM